MFSSAGSAWLVKPLSEFRSLFLAVGDEKEDKIFFLEPTSQPLSCSASCSLSNHELDSSTTLPHDRMNGSASTSNTRRRNFTHPPHHHNNNNNNMKTFQGRALSTGSESPEVKQVLQKDESRKWSVHSADERKWREAKHETPPGIAPSAATASPISTALTTSTTTHHHHLNDDHHHMSNTSSRTNNTYNEIISISNFNVPVPPSFQRVKGSGKKGSRHIVKMKEKTKINGTSREDEDRGSGEQEKEGNRYSPNSRHNSTAMKSYESRGMEEIYVREVPQSIIKKKSKTPNAPSTLPLPCLLSSSFAIQTEEKEERKKVVRLAQDDAPLSFSSDLLPSNSPLPHPALWRTATQDSSAPGVKALSSSTSPPLSARGMGSSSLKKSQARKFYMDAPAAVPAAAAVVSSSSTGTTNSRSTAFATTSCTNSWGSSTSTKGSFSSLSFSYSSSLYYSGGVRRSSLSHVSSRFSSRSGTPTLSYSSYSYSDAYSSASCFSSFTDYSGSLSFCTPSISVSADGNDDEKIKRGRGSNRRCRRRRHHHHHHGSSSRRDSSLLLPHDKSRRSIVEKHHSAGIAGRQDSSSSRFLPPPPPAPPPFPPSSSRLLVHPTRYLLGVLETHEIICVSIHSNADEKRGPVEMQRYPPPPYLRTAIFAPVSSSSKRQGPSLPCKKGGRGFREDEGARGGKGVGDSLGVKSSHHQSGISITAGAAAREATATSASSTHVESNGTPACKKKASGSHNTKKSRDYPYPTSFSLIPPSIGELLSSSSSLLALSSTSRPHQNQQQQLRQRLRGVVGGSDGRVNVFSNIGYSFGFAAHQSPVVAAHAIYTLQSHPMTPTISTTPTPCGIPCSTHDGWASPSSSSVYFPTLGFITSAEDGSVFIWSYHRPYSSEPRRGGKVGGRRGRVGGGRQRRGAAAASSSPAPPTFVPQKLFSERSFMAKMMALNVYYPPLVDLSRYMKESTFMNHHHGAYDNNDNNNIHNNRREDPKKEKEEAHPRKGIEKQRGKKTGQDVGGGGGPIPIPTSTTSLSSFVSDRLWRLSSLLPCAVLCHVNTQECTLLSFYSYPSTNTTAAISTKNRHSSCSKGLTPPPSSSVSFACRSLIPLPPPRPSSCIPQTWVFPSSSLHREGKCSFPLSSKVYQWWKAGKETVMGIGSGGGGNCTAVATNGQMTLLARDYEIYYIPPSASLSQEKQQYHQHLHYGRSHRCPFSSSSFARRASLPLKRLSSCFSRKSKREIQNSVTTFSVPYPSSSSTPYGIMMKEEEGAFFSACAASSAPTLPPIPIFRTAHKITSIHLGHHVAILAALKDGAITIISPTLPHAVRLAQFSSYHQRPLRQVLWCEDAALLGLVDQSCGVAELVMLPPSILSMAEAVMHNQSGEGLASVMVDPVLRTSTCPPLCRACPGGGYARKKSSLFTALRNRGALFTSQKASRHNADAAAVSHWHSRFDLPPPSTHPLTSVYPTIRLLQAKCTLDEVLVQRRHVQEMRRREISHAQGIMNVTGRYTRHSFPSLSPSCRSSGWRRTHEDGSPVIIMGEPGNTYDETSSMSNKSKREGRGEGEEHCDEKEEKEPENSRGVADHRGGGGGEARNSDRRYPHDHRQANWHPHDKKDEEVVDSGEGGHADGCRGEKTLSGMAGVGRKGSKQKKNSSQDKSKKIKKMFTVLHSPEIPYGLREVVGNIRRTVQNRADALRHPHAHSPHSGLPHQFPSYASTPLWGSSSLCGSSPMEDGEGIERHLRGHSLFAMRQRANAKVMKSDGGGFSFSGGGGGKGGSALSLYPSVQRCREALILAKMLCDDEEEETKNAVVAVSPPSKISSSTCCPSPEREPLETSLSSLETCDGGD